MKEKRVRNWGEYNKALVQRGKITLWIDEACLRPLHSPLTKKRGRPIKYSNGLIQAGLTLKNVFHLSFRSLEGFLLSLFELSKIPFPAPNYTTLQRRQAGLSQSDFTLTRKSNTPIDLVVDSTGLKIYGEGEWCVKKHGAQYQRTWRKVHLAVNAGNLEIVSCKLTESRVQDADTFEELLDSIDTPITQVIGDGAYDQFKCYESAYKRGAQGVFPPRNGAKLSKETGKDKKAASAGAIQQRDNIVEQANQKGKKHWKVDSGYHQRSLAEMTMYRLKQLLGERLRAKVWENQSLELQIRCYILNKIMALGRAAPTTA
jgi:hypothetical protein